MPCSAMYRLPAVARRAVLSGAVRQAVRNYAAKDLKFSLEARGLLIKGVDKLADAVSVTMGPKVSSAHACVCHTHRIPRRGAMC